MNDEMAIYRLKRKLTYEVVIDIVIRILKHDKKNGPLTISEASFLMFQDLGD